MTDMTAVPEARASLPGVPDAPKDRRKDSLLRIRTVVARTGLSIGTIYRRECEGTFPRKERIGGRCVAWYESDIDDFVSDPLGYRAP